MPKYKKLTVKITAEVDSNHFYAIMEICDLETPQGYRYNEECEEELVDGFANHLAYVLGDADEVEVKLTEWHRQPYVEVYDENGDEVDISHITLDDEFSYQVGAPWREPDPEYMLDDSKRMLDKIGDKQLDILDEFDDDDEITVTPMKFTDYRVTMTVQKARDLIIESEFGCLTTREMLPLLDDEKRNELRKKIKAMTWDSDRSMFSWWTVGEELEDVRDDLRYDDELDALTIPFVLTE